MHLQTETIGIDSIERKTTQSDGGGMMTMAPGMEVASSSNPSNTSDPLSPHSNARSPVNASATSWYPPPPPSVTDPRYASSAQVDHMMMPGACRCTGVRHHRLLLVVEAFYQLILNNMLLRQ